MNWNPAQLDAKSFALATKSPRSLALGNYSGASSRAIELGAFWNLICVCVASSCSLFFTSICCFSLIKYKRTAAATGAADWDSCLKMRSWAFGLSCYISLFKFYLKLLKLTFNLNLFTVILRVTRAYDKNVNDTKR